MASILGSVSIISSSEFCDENHLKEVEHPEHRKKSSVSVSFVENVTTILIPTISEYKKAGLFTLLWWDRFDYEMFKLGAMKEVDNFLRNNFSTAALTTTINTNLNNNNNSSNNNNNNNNNGSSSNVSDGSYHIQDLNIQNIMKKLYQPFPIELDNNSNNNNSYNNSNSNSSFENENVDVNVTMNKSGSYSNLTLHVSGHDSSSSSSSSSSSNGRSGLGHSSGNNSSSHLFATSPPAMDESDIDKQLFVID